MCISTLRFNVHSFFREFADVSRMREIKFTAIYMRGRIDAGNKAVMRKTRVNRSGDGISEISTVFDAFFPVKLAWQFATIEGRLTRVCAARRNSDERARRSQWR